MGRAADLSRTHAGTAWARTKRNSGKGEGKKKREGSRLQKPSRDLWTTSSCGGTTNDEKGGGRKAEQEGDGYIRKREKRKQEGDDNDGELQGFS